ncbi:MAG: hypothetical protein HY924_13140 [Elusimicrobia bacterium]|nr:hypothetical protein [Elusimicrobiota bacterium]
MMSYPNRYPLAAAALTLSILAFAISCKPQARCISLPDLSFEIEPGEVNLQGTWIDEASGTPVGFNAHTVYLSCRKAAMACDESISAVMPSVTFAGATSPPSLHSVPRPWKVASWTKDRIRGRRDEPPSEGAPSSLEIDLKAETAVMDLGGDKPRRQRLGSGSPYCLR